MLIHDPDDTVWWWNPSEQSVFESRRYGTPLLGGVARSAGVGSIPPHMDSTNQIVH